MYKYLIVLVACVVSITYIIPSASSQEPVPTPTVTATPTPPPKPTVVSVRRHRPRRTITRRRTFTPAAYPSAAYIQGVIIPVEAATWGASAARLSCRIYGESRYEWSATNGQYVGVGQFAPSTFYRGVSSIGTRRVQYTPRVTHRRRPTVVRTTMSDGSHATRRVHWRRQRVVHVRYGWLPREPVVRHTWEQVRIMARAMVGLGAVNDSEWEVRC